MKILTDLVARLLFAIPMLIFGVFHFMNAEGMAGMAPFGGAIMVYITGLALLAAAVSIVIKKKAALATLLLGIFFLLTAAIVWAPQLGTNPDLAMPMLLKDTALAGGAFFMSGVFKNEEESQAE